MDVYNLNGRYCHNVDSSVEERRQHKTAKQYTTNTDRTNTICKKQALSRMRIYNFSYCDWVVILTALLLLCRVPVSAIRWCDPKNSESTCKYMGKCVSIALFKQYNPKIAMANSHVCTCPSMNCYYLPEEMVCADDGETKTTFYNDMCRRIRECETQKPLKRVCRGKCGDSTCRPFDSNIKRCPEEKEDYCHHGGLCLIYRDETSNPFCKCPRGYTGPRCKEKSLLNLLAFSKEIEEEEKEDDIRGKNG